MGPRDLYKYHEPALASEQVKHGLLIYLLGLLGEPRSGDFLHWSLGEPGQCAVKMAHHSIVLGALDETQCRKLADITNQLDYPGVIGPDLTARWFANRAMELGVRFLDPISQQIYSLSDKPRYPGASGYARPIKAEDAPLFVEWMLAFHHEAVPHDPVPTHGELERVVSEGNYLFWIDKGQPVSMAGIVRRLKDSAAITGVYTPPGLRGRRYAGSITAAIVERIYAEGRGIACLYTDVSNPFSNRCYTRIGFKPVCGSLHFHRHMAAS
jgi:RimJ/RimL family protein N-acetyltransferase